MPLLFRWFFFQAGMPHASSYDDQQSTAAQQRCASTSGYCFRIARNCETGVEKTPHETRHTQPAPVGSLLWPSLGDEETTLGGGPLRTAGGQGD